ncbi:cation:proton antiporter subunit C [Sorangium sp. So ce513]|uniref:cation:proton antiporter subunit C n=1 Tax=Sorangium sp. So ce513 TaxID=3133315 RepID=UPI003F6263C5
MKPWTLYALSGVIVMAAALYGLFSTGYLLRKVIAANLVGSGVFLILVALARRSSSGTPDPVPHALVLTGIVVSVSATALALSLARRLGGAADAPGPPASTEREADDP